MRRTGAIRWLWIAVAVIWALGGIRMFLFHLSYDPFADIHIYYEAAARLNAGEPLYPPGARIYPPLFSILFRPLALLPFELAAAIWEGILLAALGLTLWLIGIRNRSTWWAVLILSIGIAWTLAIGQVEAIVTLLLAIGSPFTVALAGNIKVFPLAVGIFWLVRGDWRSVLRLAAWTAGLVALQLVLDPANTLAFPATLAPGQVASEVASEGNLSPFVLAPILWAIVVVIELAIAIRFARTRWGWAAAVGLAVLAPPRVFSYNLMTLLACLGGPEVVRAKLDRVAGRPPPAIRTSESMTGRTAGIVALVGALGWIGLIWLGVQLYGTNPRTAGFDLELLLGAGRAVASGESPYDPALVAGAAPVAERLFYSYPPIVAQLMALVAWVPSPVMFVAWATAAVAGLGFVARQLAIRFGAAIAPNVVAITVVALVPLMFPLAVGLLFGNLDVFFPLAFGLLLLGLVPSVGARDAAVAGTATTMAAVAKLHPGSLGVWLLARSVSSAESRRIVVAAVVALIVVVGTERRRRGNATLVRLRGGGPGRKRRRSRRPAECGSGRPDRPARRRGRVRRRVACADAPDPGHRDRASRDSRGRAARQRPRREPRLGRRRVARRAAGHLVPLPSALIPFALAAVLRASPGAPSARVLRTVAVAALVAAVAIAWLPLIYVAIGLVIAAVRMSRPSVEAGAA